MLTGQEWFRLRDLVEQDLTMVTQQIVNIQKTPDIHEPQDLVAHQEEAVALQTLLVKLDAVVIRIPG